jgi:outer membrane receptor protein involved in Fe transport
LPNTTSQYTQSYGSFQYQSNVTEAFTWTHGKHLFKFGGTWMQTTAYFGRGIYSRGPLVDYHFDNATRVLSGVPGTQQVNEFERQNPISNQWGIYAQDEWRATPV